MRTANRLQDKLLLTSGSHFIHGCCLISEFSRERAVLSWSRGLTATAAIKKTSYWCERYVTAPWLAVTTHETFKSDRKRSLLEAADTDEWAESESERPSCCARWTSSSQFCLKACISAHFCTPVSLNLKCVATVSRAVTQPAVQDLGLYRISHRERCSCCCCWLLTTGRLFWTCTLQTVPFPPSAP